MKKLVVQTLKEFCVSRGFTQFAPSVRVNTNGYPFVTFIDKDNKAENIYFSKASSKGVDAGVVVNKALFAGFQIGLTTNAQGESRVKLISNSERVDVNSLWD